MAIDTTRDLAAAAPGIDTVQVQLPRAGVTLNCRVAGPQGAPMLMFLHGFPEAAFVWDELLLHFCSRYRCVAPNLRGYEHSSAPTAVAAYRTQVLVADIAELLDQLGAAPLEALVAHDWGGALAWNFAVKERARLQRLVIINSPHPATFLRELQSNPQQQAASAYMLKLCAPEAEARLSADDFARLWGFFTRMGADDATKPGGGWLTPALRDRYREVWQQGLTGALNYYRASPMRPPEGPDSPVMSLQFPPQAVTVQVPTHVVWGEADTALPVALLDGLQAFVPRLRIARVPGATHWIIHEQPARVIQEIEAVLDSPAS